MESWFAELTSKKESFETGRQRLERLATRNVNCRHGYDIIVVVRCYEHDKITMHNWMSSTTWLRMMSLIWWSGSYKRTNLHRHLRKFQGSINFHAFAAYFRLFRCSKQTRSWSKSRRSLAKSFIDFQFEIIHQQTYNPAKRLQSLTQIFIIQSQMILKLRADLWYQREMLKFL